MHVTKLIEDAIADLQEVCEIVRRTGLLPATALIW